MIKSVKILTAPLDNDLHKNKIFVLCTKPSHTCIEVAEYMWTKYSIHTIGLLNPSNIVDIPMDMIITKNDQNNHHIGELRMSKRIINGQSYYLISWMNYKPVHILSTFPTTKSNERIISNTDNSKNTKSDNLPEPDIYKCYKNGQLSVEFHEDVDKNYRPNINSNRWEVHIFAHIIYSIVTNSYILHQSFYNFDANDLSLLDFIELILHYITKDYEQNRSERPDVNNSTNNSNEDMYNINVKLLKVPIIQEKLRRNKIDDVDNTSEIDIKNDNQSPNNNCIANDKIDFHITNQDLKTGCANNESNNLNTKGNVHTDNKSIENDKLKYNTNKHFAVKETFTDARIPRKRDMCNSCNKKKVATKCKECDVYLCIDETHNSTSCSRRYHE